MCPLWLEKLPCFTWLSCWYTVTAFPARYIGSMHSVVFSPTQVVYQLQFFDQFNNRLVRIHTIKLQYEFEIEFICDCAKDWNRCFKSLHKLPQTWALSHCNKCTIVVNFNKKWKLLLSVCLHLYWVHMQTELLFLVLSLSYLMAGKMDSTKYLLAASTIYCNKYILIFLTIFF